jgi:hypothetical protein
MTATEDFLIMMEINRKKSVTVIINQILSDRYQSYVGWINY